MIAYLFPGLGNICKKWIFFLIVLFISQATLGQTTFSGTGNWSTPARWSAGIPGAGTAAIIASGAVCTVDGTGATCASLTFAANGSNSSVTITNDLSVVGAIAYSNPSSNNNSQTINVGNGTLSCGSLSMANTSNTRVNNLTVIGGTITVNGSITCNGSAAAENTIAFSGTGKLNISGNFVITTLTFTPGSGTVNYNASGAQTAGVLTYNNLTLSGSNIKTFATTPTVNGILSMEGTATVTVTTGVVTYGTNATLQYNTATARTASSEEWITPFSGSGGVIIASTGAITLDAAKVFNASVPLTINSGGSLATNNFQMTFGGNFVNGGTFTAGSSPIVIANTMVTQNIAGFTTTGLVSMTKTAGTATLTGNMSGNGLTINGNGGTLHLGSGLTHTITGAWTNTIGTLNGGSSTLNLGNNGTFTAGTFTCGTGTVDYYAAGAQNVAGVTYYNLTISGSGIKTIQGNVSTTNNLTINAGTLSFGTILRTVSVAGNLSGSGTIDMSGGPVAHILNLGGASNSIGTLTTAASGSIVNYNRAGDQQVFGSNNYQNISISGSGVKSLQASSSVNGTLTLSSGTFTIGANTLTLNGPTIAGTPSNLITSAASSLIFGGTSAGILIPSSVVNLNNLTINNTNGVSLSGGVTVGNILTMTTGNITTGGNTLILSNSTSENLSYAAGTIVGRFQRAIGSTGTEYLYPVGTATVYNPFKISFTDLTAGQLAVQFMANDIGVAGLPLNDAGTEIFDRQTTGYWTLTAVAPMASTDYSVKLNYSGFTGVDSNARILMRTNGGNLTLNGDHGTLAGSEISRTAMTGISTTTSDLAIGKPTPRFTTQPSDFSGCTATFSVTVSGKAPLTYLWQENNGGGFTNITNGGIYSGATSNSLLISGATQSMNGYQYRCIVTDVLAYTSTSNSATLTTTTSNFGYNYSMDVTLDPASGTSDLTDFPALISITSSLLRTTAMGGHTYSSNGYDIIFTDQNGSKLDHQIESYDASTGNYIAWVRIPKLLQSASTTIRMFYGNPAVSLNPSVRSVWTSSYKGVWHLNGTDYTDGTSYSNNGTNTNTTTVTGRIAGGRGFNGTTAYINVPTNGFVPNDNNQTISIWANYAVTPSGNRNLISFQAGQSGSAIQLGFRGGNAVAWEWGGTILADGGAAPSINTWHYYVYSYDGTTSRFYVDGVLKGSSTVAPQTLLPTEGNMGRYNDGEYLAANLDEPRFSMSPKSSGWILTEYNNQNDPANFISLGAETNATLLASVGICSTTYTLNQGFPTGGTYSGTGVSGTNFNASVAGLGTHAITYLYTDVNGCSTSASKNIIVTPVPAAPASSNKDCCYLNVVDLEATGTNIKWYSDAGLTTLVGNGTPFATGKTTAGVYTYYATQTINGCESTATTVSLTISPSISISTQPQPTSICTTGTGTFSVIASGYNLTYQWQENLSNITNGGVYSGATTATLTLTNPGIGLNGRSYRCVVSSSCGTPFVDSNGALLTVTTLPIATFSYTGTPYCPNAANPSPTFSGGGVAGTFSSSAGLVFVSSATGQVDLAASTPGSYTITNTIAAAGGCAVVTATSPFSLITNNIWLGGSTDWNVPANWSCGALPGQTTSVQIPNIPNKPVLSLGAVGTVKDLTIDAGSSLTISGNTIQISGVISNNGTFTASSGTIELNGSVAQSINANTFSGNTIRNLNINNAAGVSLNGSLNITGIVTPQSGVFSAGNFLTLISDASGTALISGSGTGSVTGNVTMQRYLPSGFGYKYFSSPFEAATVNQFSDDMTLGSFSFFRYNENSAGTGWIRYNYPDSLLNVMQGYAVNFGSNSAANTIDITGAVNNGALSVNLFNHDSIYTNGFNLVGNPYPSPIDWNAVSGWTKTNINNALYFFKASSTDQYGGRYGTYISGISSDGDSSLNIIPSMQGFFVRVSTGTYPVTGTLGMTNSVRVTDMTHPFLKSALMFSPPLIRLTGGFSDDNESFDPTVIYFDEKATTVFDSQLDALKLFNTDFSIANLYALGSDGAKLSINALPIITDTLYSIPLGLNLNRTGNIIIKVRDIDASLSGMRVYLTDIVTGSVQDLSGGNYYQINLGTGEYINRFFLNLDNLSTQIPSGTPAVEPFSVYSTQGILKAEINTKPGEKGTFYIYNLTGQVLFLEKINEPGYHEFIPGVKDGIYIVTFVSGNKISSKKIIIKN